MAQKIIRTLKKLRDLEDVEGEFIADKSLLRYKSSSETFVFQNAAPRSQGDLLTSDGENLTVLGKPFDDDSRQVLSYDDKVQTGITWKKISEVFPGLKISCYIASLTEIIPLLRATGPTIIQSLDVIENDTPSLQDGDRILLKDQSNAIENGIYRYDASGNGGLGGLVRADDAPSGDVLEGGELVVVKAGDNNGNTIFTLDNNRNTIIDTDPQYWVPITSLGGGAQVLHDLLDVEADSPNLVGKRYLKFDPNTKLWYAILLDFVESVQGYTGNVLLSTNDIPETDQRRYFNRTRFLTEAQFSNLDIIGDVEYDNTFYDGNVLMWSGAKSKWTPRPVLANLRIGDLLDVMIDYNNPWNRFCIEHIIYRTIVTYDPVENKYNSTLQDTGQRRFITYILSTDCGGVQGGADRMNWRPNDFRHALGRYFLEDFQNVVDTGRSHGRALMWDEELYKWRPGGFVELRTSDDLTEGIINLYLTDHNLPRVADRALSLGHLRDVDDFISSMTTLNSPAAKVLGWRPEVAQWQAINALTEDANTSNIDEAVFQPMGTRGQLPWGKHPVNRGYFTGERVMFALQEWGRLDWIDDVFYRYGRTHGQSLVWDSQTQKWIASNPTSAVNTDFLPEGAENLYYTDERVRHWTYYNIHLKGLNYFHNVRVNEPPTEPNHAIVWDATSSTWVSGYPTPLPIVKRGDLLVGKGSPTDYGVVPIDKDGKYLRVDYTAEFGVGWKDPDPIYATKLQFPDIPIFKYTRSKDLSGLIYYLGIEYGTATPVEYQNPVIDGLIKIYSNLDGSAASYLFDRVYYSAVTGGIYPTIESIDAPFLNISSTGILIDFVIPNAYRPIEMVLQCRAEGKRFFRIFVSDDSVNWIGLNENVREGEVPKGYRFEISSQMYVEGIDGVNSEIVDSDASLDTRWFYKIKTPFKDNGIGSDELADGFWRFMRILPEQDSTGNIDLYNIEFYGYYNTGIKFHTLVKDDVDKYLISAVNNLEIVLPGSFIDVDDLQIDDGFQCWLISDSEHSTNIYTTNVGRVFTNIQSEAFPTINNPLILPPRSMAKIVYGGKDTETYSVQPFLRRNIVRWHVIFTGSGGGGGTGAGLDSETERYFLDRANHFGKQNVDSIVGLSRVALSNNYSDLTNLPALAPVATAGSYQALTNLPILGTASQFDVGTEPFSLVQLDDAGRLPALDGSLLTNLRVDVDIEIVSPLRNKGDIFVRNNFGDTRFPISAVQGHVLTVDSTTPTGLAWKSLSSATTDATLFGGNNPDYYLDRNNHVGFVPVGAIAGLHPVATLGDYNSLINRPTIGTAASFNVGTGDSNIVQLTPEGKLPVLDASNLFNVGGSPLINPGDLYIRGVSGEDVAFPVGTEGQVLTVDETNPVKLAWKSSSVTNALFLDGNTPAFLLDRANHTGTQDALTIDGLSLVATSGLYSDLIGAPNPNFHAVAYSGRYSDLIGRPTLGTASSFNAGLQPFNLLQLDSTGQIPASLRSATNSPTEQLGDLIARAAAGDTRLPVGLNGQVLSANNTTNTGLEWIDIPNIGGGGAELPFTLKGDIVAYDGTQTVIIRKGVEGAILTVTNNGATGLQWIQPTFGGDMYKSVYDSNLNGIVDLAEAVNGAFEASARTYYGKDANNNVGFHPIPTNSPLTSKGDIYVHNGLNNVRLAVGINNQILIADNSTISGLRWVSSVPSATNAVNLAGNPSEHYLNRANHTGTQPLSSISGLGTAASFNVGTSPSNVVQLGSDGKLPPLDASRLYNLPGGGGTGDGGGTTTGNISVDNVIGLGSAAILNAGVGGYNVIQLEADGKIPPLDASNLFNLPLPLPLTTKGDLVARGNSGLVRIPLGAEGYVLTVDPFTASGVSWGNEIQFAVEAQFLMGNAPAYYLNRSNHTGTQDISSIVQANRIVLLTSNGKLPALDASNLLNVPISLPGENKGDILVWTVEEVEQFDNLGNPLPPQIVEGYRALGLGTLGQVLAANPNTPEGVQWINPPAADGSGGGLVDATYFEGRDGAFYLDRANHTGTIDANLFNGNNPGYYLNRLNHVGNIPYTNVTGLGNVVTLNVGSDPFNIVQLDINGKLPRLDASNLTNVFAQLPLNAKGQLIGHNGVETALLEPGANGTYLIRDDSRPTGLRWVQLNLDLGGIRQWTFHLHSANFTATKDSINLVNTFTIAVNAFLPANASNGDRVSFSDYLGNFAVRNLTIIPSPTHTIAGNSNLVLSINNANVELIFWDNRWVIRGSELGLSGDLDISALDANGDGIIDFCEKVRGIDSAASRTYYGKNSLGNIGFWALPIDPPVSVKGDLYTHNGTSATKIPLGSQGQLLAVDPTTATGLRWINSVSNSGDANNLNGHPGSFYLNRANHTGTQPLSSITGLGTAASLNVGFNPLNIVQLDLDAKLPPLDASNLFNIPSNDTLKDKGDLLGFNGTATVPIKIGINRSVLVVDETTASGVAWANIVAKAEDADTLNGDSPAYYRSRSNHTGVQDVSTITGLGTSALLDVGVGPENIVQLTPDGKLPPVDGSNILNAPLNTPFTTRGDLLTFTGTATTRFSRGQNGQVLVSDSTTTTGLRWETVDALTSNELTPVYINSATVTPNNNSICILDTTNQSILVTLPNTPPNGTRIILVDYAGNFSINSVTVATAVSNSIMGKSALVLNTNYATIQLIFWNNRWLIYGTETPETSVQNVYDQNKDGIIDSTEKVEGIDLALNYSYYGKDGDGNTGFFQPTILNGGEF